MAPPTRYRLLWRRFRPHLLSWVGMVPFLVFALFPFYWMVITSLKADANLYDLSRNPFFQVLYSFQGAGDFLGPARAAPERAGVRGARAPHVCSPR